MFLLFRPDECYRELQLTAKSGFSDLPVTTTPLICGTSRALGEGPFWVMDVLPPRNGSFDTSTSSSLALDFLPFSKLFWDY